MLAVNAKIGGKTADVNKLIKEYKLNTAELGKRLEMRDGEKYSMTRKPGGGRPKGSTNKAGRRGRPAKSRAQTEVKATRVEDLISLMGGRTKTATLLRIAYKASELLDKKPKEEVQKVEKAMEQAEELKQKYQDAVKLIGEEIPI